ncbi:MAG: hypothetical protein QNJ69_08645 [Gammaproteobacteria bacterium]|nr:hypothetical protein [Gammaproteobacteria bacterium]
MLNKSKILVIALGLLTILSMPLAAQEAGQEFMTLFTTQQERRLIDNNRYRPPVTEVKTVEVDEEPAEQKQSMTYHQHSISFELAGVTLAEDGNHVAWVNGDRVENGDEIGDGFRVYISPRLNNLVQIKSPDGVFHNIQTGKRIDIKYMKPAEG